jgi:Iron-containing redox enzyme
MLCAEHRNSVASRLQDKLAPLMAEVSVRSRLMAEHARPKAMYATLLEFLYSDMRASVPLLIAAKQKAAELAAGGDAVSQGLIDWLGRHALAEAGHDLWLLGDYSRIGGDAALLASRPGSPSVGAMVGSVYYWTLHAHPIAILGYAAVLEGTPPTTTFIDRMMWRTGFPPDAFHALREHAAIDEEHGIELFVLLDSLPLTSEHEAIVGMTALQTADLLIAIGDELLNAADNHHDVGLR